MIKDHKTESVFLLTLQFLQTKVLLKFFKNYFKKLKEM